VDFKPVDAAVSALAVTCAAGKIGEADLSEGQEEKLRRVLDKTVNAVRVWESFGSPTLFQAIEAGRAAAMA
jgi:hypothetical protein